MFASALFFSLLVCWSEPQEAVVTEAVTSLPAEIKTEANSETKWQFELEGELRGTQHQIYWQQSKREFLIQELGLGIGFVWNSDLKFYSKALVQSAGTEKNSFYLEEMHLTYQIAKGWSEVRVGQIPLPLGSFVTVENQLSVLPWHYQYMLGSIRGGYNLGGHLALFPWQQKWISLEAAQFVNEYRRPSDDYKAKVKTPPQVVGLRSQSDWHSAYLQKWQQEYEFMDPMSGVGAGIELTTASLLGPHWQFTFSHETWSLLETQKIGPDQSSLSYNFHPRLRWRKITAGVRASRVFFRLSSVASAPAPIKEDAYYARWQVLKPVAIQGEHIKRQQGKQAIDDWTGRILVEWTL